MCSLCEVFFTVKYFYRIFACPIDIFNYRIAHLKLATANRYEKKTADQFIEELERSETKVCATVFISFFQ